MDQENLSLMIDRYHGVIIAINGTPRNRRDNDLVLIQTESVCSSGRTR